MYPLYAGVFRSGGVAIMVREEWDEREGVREASGRRGAGGSRRGRESEAASREINWLHVGELKYVHYLLPIEI